VLFADPSGRAVQGVGLRSLDCWDLSFVSVVCCQVEVSAWGWSPVQRSPTVCGVSECDSEASIMWRPWPTRGCCALGGGEYVLFIERGLHVIKLFLGFIHVTVWQLCLSQACIWYEWFCGLTGRVPILSVFPGTVPLLKEMPRCPDNFSGDAQMLHFLIWGMFPSYHCNHAICPYPMLMINEFSIIFGFVCVLVEIDQAFDW
jgi:hypothetical protein